MWNKSILSVVPTLQYHRNRLIYQNVRSISNGSYLHNPGTSPLHYITLGDMMERTANKYPKRVALRSVHEDVTLTYTQMLNQAQRLGCALRSQGLKKGDRLGIWSHNTASSIVTLLAAVQVGLIPVEINPMYEKSELSFCIKKAGLKSIFLSDKLPNRDYYQVLSEVIPEIRKSKEGEIRTNLFPDLTSVIVDSKEKLPGAFTYNSLINDYSSSEIGKYAAEVSPDDGAIIYFTSGTTGAPKAALSSHFSVANNTRLSGLRSLFHQGEQKICVQVPLFHALGTTLTVLSGYNHGAGIVLSAPVYSTKANLHTIVNEKCTAITGTPTMYVDLLSLLRQTGAKIDSLKTTLTAGAPCSPQLIRDIQKELNVQNVKALYGMTEATGGVCQSIEGESIEIIAETVGYISDHTEIKVVDENDKLVPFGCAGEALVRGYSTMMGYWDDPEKTRKVLGTDNWLRSGDKLVLTEDGYGRIVGRIKDIIVRGGENIAPKEIEDHLNTHPDIVDSQVIGVSDERLGEELCAVLRLKEGKTFTEQDLKNHCTGTLSKFKIPRIIKTIEEFPKTTSGKVQKFKLKDLVESGKL